MRPDRPRRRKRLWPRQIVAWARRVCVFGPIAERGLAFHSNSSRVALVFVVIFYYCIARLVTLGKDEALFMSRRPSKSKCGQIEVTRSRTRPRPMFAVIVAATTAAACGKCCDPPPQDPVGGTGGSGLGGTWPGNAGVGAGGGMLRDGLPYLINIPRMPQGETKWCWAASAAMIATYLDEERKGELTQCKFASVGVPEDCCVTGDSKVCNRSGFPPFKAKNFSYEIHQSGWPSWNGVVAELRANRPFGIIETYPVTGGAHMTVVSGGHVVKDDEVMKVYDPAGDGASWWHEFSDYRVEDPDRKMGYTYYHVRVDSNPQCHTDDPPPDACILTDAPQNGILPGCSTTHPPDGQPVGHGSEVAAAAGLARVRLIGAVDPESVGFHSKEEAETRELTFERLELHDAILRPIVGGCESVTSQPAKTDDYVYVAKDTGVGLGFIEVRDRGPGWKPIQYGDGNDAAEVQKMVNQLRSSNPLFPRPPRRPTLIRIRPLGLYLLVEPTPAGVRYYPSRMIGGLKKGEPVSAKTVTKMLRSSLPAVINGLPF